MGWLNPCSRLIFPRLSVSLVGGVCCAHLFDTPRLTFCLEGVQNMVSNLAYSRWTDIYPELRAKIDELHNQFTQQVSIVDQRAVQLLQKESVDAAIKYVTFASVNAGNKLHQAWLEFYGQLFAKYRDFYTIVPNKNKPGCGCDAIEPGLSEDTKRRIIGETGSQYEVEGDGDHPDERLQRVAVSM